MKEETQNKLQKKLQDTESTLHQIIKDTERREDRAQLETLKDRIQKTRKLIWDEPQVVGDDHKFTENPYQKEVEKEILGTLEKDLEKTDLESLDQETTREKLDNVLKQFEEKRKK